MRTIENVLADLNQLSPSPRIRFKLVFHENKKCIERDHPWSDRFPFMATENDTAFAEETIEKWRVLRT